MSPEKRKLTEDAINRMHTKFDWWQIKRCTRKGQKVYDVTVMLPPKNKGEKPTFHSGQAVDLHKAIDDAMKEAAKVL